MQVELHHQQAYLDHKLQYHQKLPDTLCILKGIHITLHKFI